MSAGAVGRQKASADHPTPLQLGDGGGFSVVLGISWHQGFCLCFDVFCFQVFTLTISEIQVAA
jgi:hypothetical protein